MEPEMLDGVLEVFVVKLCLRGMARRVIEREEGTAVREFIPTDTRNSVDSDGDGGSSGRRKRAEILGV